MNKILPTFRYLLAHFAVMAVIAFASILASVAITNLVFHLTDAYDGIRSVPEAAPQTLVSEITAGIFALVTGIVLFLTNFKVALVNGVSRKTFLRASLPAAALLAAALAIFNLLVLGIHNLFWPAVLTSQLTYPGIGWIGLLLVQFANNLMCIVAGWFIALAYYRSSVPMKWVISLSPAVLIGLYQVINAQTNETFGRLLREYWLVTMRTLPSIATLTLLAYAAALFGLVFLLFRRAPLKD